MGTSVSDTPGETFDKIEKRVESMVQMADYMVHNELLGASSGRKFD